MRIFLLLPMALLGACSSSALSPTVTTGSIQPPPKPNTAAYVAAVDAAMEKVQKEFPPPTKAKFDGVRPSGEYSGIVCGYVAPVTPRGKQGDLMGAYQPFMVQMNMDVTHLRPARLESGRTPSEQERYHEFGRLWSRWCDRPLV